MNLNPPQVNHFSQTKKAQNSKLQLVLLIVMVVLISWFLLLPKYSQLSDNKTLLTQLQVEHKQVSDQKDVMDKLIQKLKDSTEDVKLLEQTLPTEARITKAHVLIEQFAHDSSMALASIQTDNPETVVSAGNKDLLVDQFAQGQTLHSLTLKVNVTGTFSQFRNLTQLFDTSTRLLDIESIDITSGDDPNILSFKLKVKTYYYAP